MVRGSRIEVHLMPKPSDEALQRDARELSRSLLRRLRPERWLHTQGVASRAVELAVTVPKPDRVLLIAAALLHDIGYSPVIRDTGFHPLDGGLYLLSEGWDPRIAALVAHHSGARFVPESRGFAPLMAEFGFEEGAVCDALTYADQTVGAGGKRMTVKDRMADAIERHGPDSPNAQARVDRGPYLLSAAGRVEQRLAALKQK